MFGYNHELTKDCYGYERNEDLRESFWWYAVTTYLLCVYQTISAVQCRFFGHNIIDDSFTGPDTGYESLHCRNCGWEYEHTYY